jgi:ech hydrogenase subunit D
MIPNIVSIEKDEIVEETKKLKQSGYRFAALTFEQAGDNIELTYHFDLNYELKNLRVTVEQKASVKSISPLYPSALLIENECQDLYGLTFEGLLIDYKGRLYLAESAPKTPMLNKQ